MFITRKLHDKIVKAKNNTIIEMQKKIQKQEESLKELREEIEYEHLENYKNHRKLLAIEKLMKEQDYNSAINLKNRIRTILSRKELDVSKTY